MVSEFPGGCRCALDATYHHFPITYSHSRSLRIWLQTLTCLSSSLAHPFSFPHPYSIRQLNGTVCHFPHGVSAVLSALTLHPHFLAIFLLPTPSNCRNCLIPQGFYSTPGKVNFPPGWSHNAFSTPHPFLDRPPPPSLPEALCLSVFQVLLCFKAESLAFFASVLSPRSLLL